MAQTYRATGINLKSMPLGETDRLVTVLTSEYGLVRAVAPGARKQKSKLRGRTEPFVVNELLIIKGRSLDKIVQAETRESYPGLSRDLGKLSAGQYLAELVLSLGLSEQPQPELYDLFNEHLHRIEGLPNARTDSSAAANLLARIAHGTFHLLASSGFAPQVHTCCVTGRSLFPKSSEPHWRVQFSVEAGGILSEDSLALAAQNTTQKHLNRSLANVELFLLQQLPSEDLDLAWGERPLDSDWSAAQIEAGWFAIERLLRHYAQYHLGKSIRSATLLDTLFICEF
ncbi:MAG: DNA repair protein RecO [Cyanobacteriota bacterium]|nr:DNA repair protein RecO [Cyanobacteriota bacterium]